MCRRTSTPYDKPHLRRLKITSFHLRFSLSFSNNYLLLDSLSLLLLPRFNSSASLSVNGSKIPSDSPAFLSLHRLLTPNSDLLFASQDRLRASDGFSFEIHAADRRLLNGVFRRDDNGAWKMDCVALFDDGVGEAEISVSLEDGGVMRERVSAGKRMRRRRRRCGRLQDIPEEREEEEYSTECSCCCDDVSSGESDGEGDFEIHQNEVAMEEIGEGVRWAADVGFWVVCFGVGFLVSRASARRLRPRKLL